MLQSAKQFTKSFGAKAQGEKMLLLLVLVSQCQKRQFSG